MNGPTFNIGYDPLLATPYNHINDYTKEIDERLRYLQAMKERMSNQNQYHDNINLYEKWFPNATNNEIEDKIVEATISNWFEDEDASSDKVWEYFRVI